MGECEFTVPEVMEKANEIVAQGGTVYFTWVCEECGEKQAFTEPNTLFGEGECYKCHHVAKVKKANFIGVFFIRKKKVLSNFPLFFF